MPLSMFKKRIPKTRNLKRRKKFERLIEWHLRQTKYFQTGSPRTLSGFGLELMRRFYRRWPFKGPRTIHVSKNCYIVATHESFESVIGIELRRKDTPVGKIKIGFAPHSIIIEAIQGRGKEFFVEDTNEELKKPWANAIMEKIEENARKAGVKRILIRRPETLHVYKEHAKNAKRTDLPFVEYEKRIVEKMSRIYYALAKKMGYRKTPRFFVKDL